MAHMLIMDLILLMFLLIQPFRVILDILLFCSDILYLTRFRIIITPNFIIVTIDNRVKNRHPVEKRGPGIT